MGRDPERLASALTSIGPNGRGIAVDGGDTKAMRTVFKDLGPFDHLVLAASGSRGAGTLATLEPDELRAGFDAKLGPLDGAANSLRASEDDGSVTFISSVSARDANPGTSGLAAINGAINTMVLPLAHELAPIRVNAVSPGVVDTAWWDKRSPETKRAFFDTVASKTPVGRVGRPAEIAEAIVFLMASQLTTGVVLDVDGGLRGSTN